MYEHVQRVDVPLGEQGAPAHQYDGVADVRTDAAAGLPPARVHCSTVAPCVGRVVQSAAL